MEKNKLRTNAKRILENFWFIDQTRSDVEASVLSDWVDVEDAMQYFSAKKAGMDLILTKDYHHFYLSEIEVLSPLNFKTLFYAGRLFGR